MKQNVRLASTKMRYSDDEAKDSRNYDSSEAHSARKWWPCRQSLVQSPSRGHAVQYHPRRLNRLGKAPRRSSQIRHSTWNTRAQYWPDLLISMLPVSNYRSIEPSKFQTCQFAGESGTVLPPNGGSWRDGTSRSQATERLSQECETIRGTWNKYCAPCLSMATCVCTTR